MTDSNHTTAQPASDPPATLPNIDRYRHWAEHAIDGEPEISVVIPAYNEEWRILPTIGAIAVEISKRGEPWELIVSDDGSTDDTRKLVRDLALPNLRLLEHANTGKHHYGSRFAKQFNYTKVFIHSGKRK